MRESFRKRLGKMFVASACTGVLAAMLISVPQMVDLYQAWHAPVATPSEKVSTRLLGINPAIVAPSHAAAHR